MRRAARFRAPLALALALLGTGAALAAPAGPSRSPDDLFASGCQLYSRGEYAAAADSFREILSAGIRSSRVYYNLGNACFKQNQVGQAILYYEKALRLDPADEDARENLRYANLRIRDRIPADDSPFLLVLALRARDSVRLERVTTIFLALYLAAMALGAAWILANGRRWAPHAGIAALVLLALSLACGGWMLLQGQARAGGDEAVVLPEKVEVFSGPGSENTLLASPHEGTKVRIHNRREDWVQVTLPDGRVGWIRGETLGVI
jgi:tetratricopeptide (TPR) repeat protein